MNGSFMKRGLIGMPVKEFLYRSGSDADLSANRAGCPAKPVSPGESPAPRHP